MLNLNFPPKLDYSSALSQTCYESTVVCLKEASKYRCSRFLVTRQVIVGDGRHKQLVLLRNCWCFRINSKWELMLISHPIILPQLCSSAYRGSGLGSGLPTFLVHGGYPSTFLFSVALLPPHSFCEAASCATFLV